MVIGVGRESAFEANAGACQLELAAQVQASRTLAAQGEFARQRRACELAVSDAQRGLALRSRELGERHCRGVRGHQQVDVERPVQAVHAALPRRSVSAVPPKRGVELCEAAGRLHLPRPAWLPGRLPGEPGASRACLQRSLAHHDALMRRRRVEIELHIVRLPIARQLAADAAAQRERRLSLLRPRCATRREPVIGLQAQVAGEPHRRCARVERLRGDPGEIRVEDRT